MENKRTPLPAALDEITPLVLDSWQSVAVLPQMYKWKYYLPRIQDGNQSDYWNESTLKRFLKDVEGNELVEAAMDRGYIYIYCNGHLVTEYEIKPDTTASTRLSRLHRVDLDMYAGCDDRPSLQESSYLIELVYGGGEKKNYEIAYSEYQWPWLLVNYYGGISDSLFFNNFHGTFVHNGGLPSLKEAVEDNRLIDASTTKTAERRSKRFTSIVVEAKANNIAYFESVPAPTTSVCQKMPRSWVDAHPELTEQTDFKFPCYSYIHYSIIHAHTLALELVEDFNTAYGGLTSLLEGLNDPAQRAHFPNAEHFEAALLAARLYFATPQVQDAQTKWQRDKINVDITKRLSFDEIQRTLKAPERSLYRNILVTLTEMLGAILEPSHSSTRTWRTAEGNKVNCQVLNAQLMAYLHDFRAAPLKPYLEEDALDKEGLPIVTAHDRWDVPATLLYPFSVDATSLGLLYQGEPEYHDIYIQGVGEFKELGAELQKKIVEGDHPIAKLCMPFYIEPEYAYEKLLLQLLTSEADIEEIQNDPKSRALYEQWLALATFDQNKKAQKPDALPYISQVALDGCAWGKLIIGALPRYLMKFPATLGSLARGNAAIPELYVKHMTALMKTLSPMGISKGSLADAFDHEDLAGGELYKRSQRIQLALDFLEARQEVDPDQARRDDIRAINRQQNKKSEPRRVRDYSSVITTDTELDYYRLKESHQKASDGGRVLVLSPKDSRIWKSNLETNILLLKSKTFFGNANSGNHYGARLADDVSIGKLSTRIAGLIFFVDIYNLYSILNRVHQNGDDRSQASLVVSAISSTMGLGASAYKILEQLDKLNKIDGKESVLTKVSRFVVGSDTKWKLSKHAVMAKYLPFMGAVITLATSSSDLLKAYDNKDDVFWAHMSTAVGAALTLIGLFVTTGWVAVMLGPAGLFVGVLGFVAGKYIFRQDNLLDEWLTHGAFARANVELMAFSEYKRVWKPGQIIGQNGVPPSPIIIDGERVEGDDYQDNLDLLCMKIEEDNTVFVFDQNYVLLGLDQQGFHSISDRPIAEMAGSFVVMNGKHVAEIGRPFAEDAAHASQKMIQLYSAATGNRATVDTRYRGKSDEATIDFLGLKGDDDEKFVQPFKKFPEANVEALLNSVYPLKIALQLYPAEGFVHPRRGDHGKGNNVAITIDVPYFVEGQSKLIVELRVARGIGESRYEQRVVPFTKDRGYRIEIQSVLEHPVYSVTQHKRIVGSECEHRIYRSKNKDGIAQLMIVANIFPKRDIYKYGGGMFDQSIGLEAWARLSVNGAKETDIEVEVEGGKLKPVWMPYRSAQGWGDYSDRLYEIRRVNVVGSTGKKLEYASEDNDWVCASANDRVRN